MTRCHDQQCGQRQRCERWLQRHERNAGIRQAHTLKPAWMPHSQRCARFAWHQPITVADLLERGPAGWICHGWLHGHMPYQTLIGILQRSASEA